MLREFQILLPYLRRYRVAYAAGSLCIVASIALKLSIPHLLGGALDTLRESARGEDAGPALALDPAEVARLVAQSALVIAGVACAVALLRTASRLAILGTSRKVAHDLRGLAFDRLLRLSPSFYVRNPVGQITSRCINDMQSVQSLMGPVIMYLAETSLLLCIAVAMMLRIDPALALIALSPFPFFLYVARRLARRIQEESRASQNSLGELSARVGESLGGQALVKTLALEEHDLALFRRRCEDYRALNLRLARDRALLLALMVGLASLSIFLVLAVGGPKVDRDISLGQLAAMILYLQMLASPTRTLGFVISALRGGAAALGRIREILDCEATLADPEEEEEQEEAQASAPPRLARLRGEIEVRELSIVHPPLARQPHLSGSLPELLRGTGDAAALDRERRVLDRVSFRVPAGTTLGIVGHTGAGKTTLARAIARQIEVEPGCVFLDGRDLTQLPVRELRRQIGFVPQDAFLFSATLAENVALGLPDAPREEIERAAAAAALDKDLAQLPHGLDTLVGERGLSLSGGQRQRTALARVLLLAPPILILDDALSAVDAETEAEILAQLAPFTAGRTTVLVAHRLSTVRHADQILVLDEGRVAERGTHAELMALGGRYAATYERQAREVHRRRAGERGLRDLALEGEQA